MTAFGGEFDDAREEGTSGQPLPPEDRLWRHPSELGSSSHPLGIDPVVVRNRWLQAEPTRASAWTAGIVGAVLATGLVALGTHLAGALTGTGGGNIPTSTSASPVGASTLATVAATNASIAPSLMSRIATVGAAVAVLEVSKGASEIDCLGIVVRSDGMVLAPSAALDSATSVTVSVGGVDGYVGTVVGTDRSTGIAVVHINPVRSLVTAPISSSTPAAGTMTLAVTASSGGYALGTVGSADAAATLNGSQLVDALTVDVPGTSPIGSPVLDPMGDVVGIIVGHGLNGAVVMPSWIANPVATELIASGSVSHGWLGIVGTTEQRSGSGAGVQIVTVDPKSPAAEANLRPSDVIVSVAGLPVHTMAALHGALYVLRPGTSVGLVVRSGAKTRHIHLVLDDSPPK